MQITICMQFSLTKTLIIKLNCPSPAKIRSVTLYNVASFVNEYWDM